ncbi:tRNA pseudouridine synthase A [Colletotrichum truncatum]|uniref:tRNA pseudouridine synthase A n=1 Tax=Colletotrichum truncatum TaxID=5467 RepID=A0ACC3ZA88_COLTU|nr:tRNA pseudouridine synthase A [Colletotrichum truncatum]KAF6796156.1 tRNA pseudouridine synthase A [Colletotrichum truncatum]
MRKSGGLMRLLHGLFRGSRLHRPLSPNLHLSRHTERQLHGCRKILPAHTQKQHHNLGTHLITHLPATSRHLSISHFAKMADVAGKYDTWEKDRLIARIRQLEHELNKQQRDAAAAAATSGPEAGKADGGAPAPPPAKKRKKNKQIDPSRYSTRFIALKLAYLGKRYGGFEYATSAALPTIEGELWNALTKACLIFPEDPEVVNFDCCEYSKCGRTDRGVSAFGQVIGLRVRSNKPLPKPEPVPAAEGDVDTPMEGTAEQAEAQEEDEKKKKSKKQKPEVEWSDAREIDYIKTLNRLLPDDIRILAWCPSPPPDFSARFSCEERQYRYFFTQPAFAPTTGVSADGLKEGYLDIEAMNEAAQRFVGNHDFRNFCKVDGSKQITNFERRMFEAGVEEVKDVGSALPYLGVSAADGGKLPKVYSFNIRGTAFLWHQIRHIVSILFLVGQRLEKPEIVTELLDIEKSPRKPNYDLAHETPLVLWNCVFPGDPESRTQQGAENALKWVHGEADIVENLWTYYRDKKMDELLANRLLDLVSGQVQGTEGKAKGTRVFGGGHLGKLAGEYVSIKRKQLTPTPQEINDRWAQRKGFKNSDEMRESKNWRKAIKDAKDAKKAASVNGDADE